MSTVPFNIGRLSDEILNLLIQAVCEGNWSSLHHILQRALFEEELRRRRVKGGEASTSALTIVLSSLDPEEIQIACTGLTSSTIEFEKLAAQLKDADRFAPAS